MDTIDKPSITLSKYTHLNYIDDVDEPKYSTNEVIIANFKITRSKYDIKFKFRSVGPTSEYAGTYFLTKKDAMKGKQRKNNGLSCRVVSWDKFKKLNIIDEETWR